MKGAKNRLKKQMIGAYVKFDGDESNEQVGRLRNGVNFLRQHLDAFQFWSWTWQLDIAFVFENGKLPERHSEVSIATDTPLRLGHLTDLVLDIQTKEAIKQPDGYKYKTKIWTAKILRPSN